MGKLSCDMMTDAFFVCFGYGFAALKETNDTIGMELNRQKGEAFDKPPFPASWWQGPQRFGGRFGRLRLGSVVLHPIKAVQPNVPFHRSPLITLVRPTTPGQFVVGSEDWVLMEFWLVAFGVIFFVFPSLFLFFFLLLPPLSTNVRWLMNGAMRWPVMNGSALWCSGFMNYDRLAHDGGASRRWVMCAAGSLDHRWNSTDPWMECMHVSEERRAETVRETFMYFIPVCPLEL